MKNAFSIIGTRCFYALRSVRFWCAVAVYLMFLLFATSNFYNSGVGVYYLLHYALQNGTREVLLVVCAVHAAGLFADEWNNERFIFSYTRAKKFGYSLSLILSAFTIAAMVSAIATAAYVLIFSFTNPIAGELSDEMFFQITKSYANGGLLQSGHIIAYYLFAILTQSCYMGIFTAGSVMISVKITNSYIATVCPMILYLLVTNTLSLLNAPIWLNPYNVLSGNAYLISVFSPNSKENFSVISMLYPFIYTAIFIIIFVSAAHFWIKHKYEKSSDLR